DDIVLTDRAALWIAALADAGRLLEDAALRDRAAAALDTLFDRVVDGDRIDHWYGGGPTPAPEGLLVDAVHLLGATLAVHAATGDAALLDRGFHLCEVLERRFWSRDGGFDDHDLAEPIGALRD